MIISIKKREESDEDDGPNVQSDSDTSDPIEIQNIKTSSAAGIGGKSAIEELIVNRFQAHLGKERKGHKPKIYEYKGGGEMVPRNGEKNPSVVKEVLEGNRSRSHNKVRGQQSCGEYDRLRDALTAITERSASFSRAQKLGSSATTATGEGKGTFQSYDKWKETSARSVNFSKKDKIDFLDTNENYAHIHSNREFRGDDGNVNGNVNVTNAKLSELNFYTRLDEYDFKCRNKQQIKKIEGIEKDFEICTFHPSINNSGVSRNSQMQSEKSTERRTLTQFIKDQEKTVQRKNEKIKIWKELIEEKEKKNDNFNPKLSQKTIKLAKKSTVRRGCSPNVHNRLFDQSKRGSKYQNAELISKIKDALMKQKSFDVGGINRNFESSLRKTIHVNASNREKETPNPAFENVMLQRALKTPTKEMDMSTQLKRSVKSVKSDKSAKHKTPEVIASDTDRDGNADTSKDNLYREGKETQEFQNKNSKEAKVENNNKTEISRNSKMRSSITERECIPKNHKIVSRRFEKDFLDIVNQLANKDYYEGKEMLNYDQMIELITQLHFIKSKSKQTTSLLRQLWDFLRENIPDTPENENEGENPKYSPEINIYKKQNIKCRIRCSNLLIVLLCICKYPLKGGYATSDYSQAISPDIELSFSSDWEDETSNKLKNIQIQIEKLGMMDLGGNLIVNRKDAERLHRIFYTWYLNLVAYRPKVYLRVIHDFNPKLSVRSIEMAKQREKKILKEISENKDKAVTAHIKSTQVSLVDRFLYQKEKQEIWRASSRERKASAEMSEKCTFKPEVSKFDITKYTQLASEDLDTSRGCPSCKERKLQTTAPQGMKDRWKTLYKIGVEKKLGDKVECEERSEAERREGRLTRSKSCSHNKKKWVIY